MSSISSRPRASRRARLLAFAAFAALAAAPAAAEPDWGPPPDDEFDWVQLPSGEWLKGTVTAMYQDSLEFESEELDTVSLDWGDILQLRSAQVLEVRATGNQVGRGRVTLANDVVTVDGATPETFDRGDVISVTTGAEKERDRWSGTVSLGATVQTGNTTRSTATPWCARGDARWRTACGSTTSATSIPPTTSRPRTTIARRGPGTGS